MLAYSRGEGDTKEGVATKSNHFLLKKAFIQNFLILTIKQLVWLYFDPPKKGIIPESTEAFSFSS